MSENSNESAIEEVPNQESARSLHEEAQNGQVEDNKSSWNVSQLMTQFTLSFLVVSFVTALSSIDHCLESATFSNLKCMTEYHSTSIEFFGNLAGKLVNPIEETHLESFSMVQSIYVELIVNSVLFLL